MKIGVFDSGVGGLTVVKEISKKLPRYDVVYFGDTARVPYGVRSREEIRHFSEEDMNFLISKNVSIVMIACNTISANAYDILNDYGVVLFDVIAPGVKAAITVTKNKKVGVMCTQATMTAKSHRDLFNRLDPCIQVTYQVCPSLVTLAENNLFTGDKVSEVVREYVQPLIAADVDTIILGCTHFPHFKRLIKRYAPHIQIVDPAEQMVKDLGTYISLAKEIKLYQRGKKEFYVSGNPDNFKNVCNNVLDFEVRHIQQVDVSSCLITQAKEINTQVKTS